MSQPDTPASTFSGNTIHPHTLHHVFSRFTKNELLPVRLICQNWNTAVLFEFSQWTALTLQVDCLYTEPRGRDLCTNQEQFLIDDTEAVHERLAREGQHAVVESIGQFFAIDYQSGASFARCVDTFSGGNLQRLIVYIGIVTNEHNEVMHMLSELITFTPQLKRLSIWITVNWESQHRAFEMGLFCSALAQLQALVQFDLNVIEQDDSRMRMKVHHFDLTAVLPQLERLSIGNCDIDMARLLTSAGPQLRHLKWDWYETNQEEDWDDEHENKRIRKAIVGKNLKAFSSLQTFRTLLIDSATTVTSSVTSLSLQSFPFLALELAANRFANVQHLKLATPSYRKRDLSPKLLNALRELSHLAELTLVNYHLFPKASTNCSLPAVTKLRLISNPFYHFYTERDPLSNPFRYCVNVPVFNRVVRAQFPGIQQLTLVGEVGQAERVQQKLELVLVDLEVRCFFEDDPNLCPRIDLA